MRRRRPEKAEKEACGVWLDAAALKRRKVQTHLIKPGTKMLTLLPGERIPNISFTQRRGTRQMSISSFVTLQPGMANDSNRKSIFSLKENQINQECKRTQPDCLVQGLEDDGLVSPLATSTPADIQEAGHSPPSSQISSHHSLETPSLTMMSLPQPDILMGAGSNKASLASSSTQYVESSRLLDQREARRKREWIHGSKTNCPGMGSHIRPSRGKCCQPLDKAELGEKGSAKENRQAPVPLQTWSRKKPLSVTKSPCLSVFSWDSERNDRDSWSQLFTEDSQGQQVIAHNTKMPFQDVTNVRNQGSEQFPDSPQAQCQDGPPGLHLQPNLLFTQDSEGNQVIRH
ncbi:aurora kinase A and ninein-interacting protein [Peromyscus californicus insignis]|uniref:aurora kinase A and ninein-interacting protein n=1 Tax=Peromyscus californicus insignis TaxID=564181 RepID=UPI0022A79123|nr:aurora kinase A and ninein-interacting protein [Peromyscus californicus insignis]